MDEDGDPVITTVLLWIRPEGVAPARGVWGNQHLKGKPPRRDVLGHFGLDLLCTRGTAEVIH